MNKITHHILQRVLVFHFYRVNAGFFFFWFFLLFGVPAQVLSFHLSLIQGMIQSYVFLACTLFIWLLYTLKCINYTIKQLNDPRQNFLIVLNTLTHKEQFRYMLFVHIQLSLPLWVYAGVVAVIATQQQFYGSMITVILSNITMIFLSATVYRFYLRKKSLTISIPQPRVFNSFRKPLFTIPLWFIWKERKQMLLVTKLFSLLLLYAFINLYEPDLPDIRPILLIMMLVAMAHCNIVSHIRSFEEIFLSFGRSFPIPLILRFGLLLITYSILLLPEFVFIWKGYPVHFTIVGFVELFLLAIALLSFYHSLLLMNDIDQDSYFRIVFMAGAVLFFIILYNPGIFLPLVVLGLSGILFASHFYTYEKRYR